MHAFLCQVLIRKRKIHLSWTGQPLDSSGIGSGSCKVPCEIAETKKTKVPERVGMWHMVWYKDKDAKAYIKAHQSVYKFTVSHKWSADLVDSEPVFKLYGNDELHKKVEEWIATETK